MADKAQPDQPDLPPGDPSSATTRGPILAVTSSGGIAIGQVHAVNVAIGDMTVDMRGAHISLPGAPDSIPPASPAAPPFAIAPQTGRGRNAFIGNEAEGAFRVQISYSLHVSRPCTLLNLDFDYPQPGAWEAAGGRQASVNDRSLVFGPDLRLASPLSLTPGAYAIFQAKTWQHSPGLTPAPDGAVWVRLEWAEVRRVGSQTYYAPFYLDREGILHQDTAAPAATSFQESLHAELERQRQQCQINLLRLEREALSYGQFPPLKLQNEIDFHKRKLHELETQIDELMAGTSL